MVPSKGLPTTASGSEEQNNNIVYSSSSRFRALRSGVQRRTACCCSIKATAVHYPVSYASLQIRSFDQVRQQYSSSLIVFSVCPCFSSPRRPCAGVFLFFVLLSPCSSFSTNRRGFFCYYFLVRLVFVMLSYPVRWHFTCFTYLDSFAIVFWGVFSVYQSVTT